MLEVDELNVTISMLYLCSTVDFKGMSV